MKYKVGLIEFTPGEYPGILVIDNEGEGVFEAKEGGYANADINVKTLADLQNFLKQTYADPNDDNDYLRGYNNGIRLCCATVFGGPTDFIEPNFAAIATAINEANAERPPHSYLAELEDVNRQLQNVREELESVRQSNIWLRQKETEYVNKANALVMERDEARAELIDANASAAFHARNREKAEIERERERNDLIAQRDQARSVIDYIYGPNSGRWDWKRVVEAELTPPLPLERHQQAQGLVPRYKLDNLHAANERLVSELNSARDQRDELEKNLTQLTNISAGNNSHMAKLAAELNEARTEAEHLYHAVIQTQTWCDWHREDADKNDKTLRAVATVLSGRTPRAPAPYPVLPYKMPKHMQPVPTPVGYPLPPMAGQVAPPEKTWGK